MIVDRTRYSRAEEGRLREALARGGPATCPRCEAPLSREPVPPRTDVSYVRYRDWYVCGQCGGTLVVDRARGS